VEILSAALALRERHPDALSVAERRHLIQNHRQAACLADLVVEPLGDIVRQAADLHEIDAAEWEAAFRSRYRGKSILIEDEVEKQGIDSYRLRGTAVFVRGKNVRVDVANLQLLRALPLDKTQRLLFGVRLDEVKIEPGGQWVVRFDPTSGVLLTDLGAVRACLAVPEEEFRAIVERQASWLIHLP
jgi:hypothetical protein